MSARLSSSQVAGCQVKAVEEDQWPITYILHLLFIQQVLSQMVSYPVYYSCVIDCLQKNNAFKYQFFKNINVISCYEIVARTFTYTFCKAFARHVLIDSKGLGCPGQEAVPPQESDLLRPWSRWRCLEIRSWGVFIKSGMSYQEEGEQLWPGPGVCSTTLSTHSLARGSLSDCNLHN